MYKSPKYFKLYFSTFLDRIILFITLHNCRQQIVNVFCRIPMVLAYTHTLVYPLNIFHHLIETTDEMCAVHF